MPNNNKPTPEELDEGIKKALDLPDEAADEPDEEDKSDDPKDKEEEKVDDKVDDVEADEEEVEDQPEDKKEKPEEVKEEKKTPPSTEERYKESTKEAQRLYKNNVEINKAIAEANDLPAPTEEELKAEFLEWDEMSATEKRLSTETLINKRFREHINKASAGQREIDQWVVKVDKYLEDPQTFIDHPELEGKMDKFKTYATDDTKIAGTNFDVLVKSFLFDAAKNKPAPKKGSLIEPGSGGSNEKPKPKSEKISVEASIQLRNTDYKTYKRYLAEGKIEENID